MKKDKMKAFVVRQTDKKAFSTAVEHIDIPTIAGDEVLIKALYSSLNYKDALSATGNPGVSRNFPHITGIDVAGTIAKSNNDNYKIGDQVVATGYDLGMNVKGGHSQYVKVPSSWLVKLPTSLSLKEAMIYGTAGLTASLCVDELLNNGIKNGNVLVSGATGGVGTISISILHKLGFHITALTSKKDKIKFLKDIGASKVVLIDEFDTENKKFLLKEQYHGVIDTVGGNILAHALKMLRYGGVAVCCGIASSFELYTTMFPFILRGVKLVGIDSVECHIDKKESMWKKITNEFSINSLILDKLTTQIELEDINKIYEKILNGQISGRYIVKIGDES